MMFTNSASSPAGNDIIFSAQSLNVPQRIKPTDSWSAPMGTHIYSGGDGCGDITDAGADKYSSDKTPYSRAAYAFHTRATAQNDCQNGHYESRNSSSALHEAVKLGWKSKVIPIAASTIYNGDQHAPLNNDGSYNWAATNWAADGTLVGGITEANFNDVIYGTASDETLNGFWGNDALEAGLGDDASQNTPYLIATYECHTRATAQFDCQNKHRRTQKQQVHRCVSRSNAETAYAPSVRLAGHKGLGRHVDRPCLTEKLV